MALSQKRPYLIQRCILDRRDKTLRYHDMEAAEYEFGSQRDSLKRIFKRGTKTGTCLVHAFGKEIKFYLIAADGFDFDEYKTVIQGLINREWQTKRANVVREVVEQAIIPDGEEYHFFDIVEAWFDFERNDVLFTLTKENSDFLVEVLAGTKKKWETPDPPRVQRFKRELENIKVELKKAGRRWFSLDSVKEWDGRLRVWLNPEQQHEYNCGWYTLADLRQWIKNKGNIVKK